MTPLPCPFCGLTCQPCDDADGCAVVCGFCDYVLGDWHTEAEAVAAHNALAAAQADTRRLEWVLAELRLKTAYPQNVVNRADIDAAMKAGIEGKEGA